MCGITGFNWEDKELVKRMTNTLIHRGPDGHGYYTDKNISLGHRRLAIIDLSKNGKQPMSNEDGTMWVTFNGEIYNFKELRPELEKIGHRFKSNSDTEVIVHAYEEYGYDCIKKFNGMFAFAIWDANKKELFLARDRLGKKPLYYYFKDCKFIFASEIKAILSHEDIDLTIDKDAIEYYLSFLYIPAPLSIYKYIKKLEAGHYLVFRNNVKISKYWDLSLTDNNLSKKNNVKLLEKLMIDSTSKRLISDVPLGAFLSGGLDSSLVTAIISKFHNNIKTFSIGFEEKEYDETKYARKISRLIGTEHKEFTMSYNDLSCIPKLINYFDEPHANASAIPLFYLSKMTKKYVSVALTGDGGDELFGGYNRYFAYKIDRFYKLVPKTTKFIIKLFNNTPISPLAKKYRKRNYLEKYISAFNKSLDKRHLHMMQYLDEKEKSKLYKFKPKEQVLFNKYSNKEAKDALDLAFYIDIKTDLQNNVLTNVDRMTMANSLEIRSPILDYRIAELSSAMPSSLKVNGLTRKYILKKVALSYLPKDIIYRKKSGLSTPIDEWFRNDLKDMLMDTSKNSPFLNYKEIEKMINLHSSKEKNLGLQLYSILNLHLWYNNHRNLAFG